MNMSVMNYGGKTDMANVEIIENEADLPDDAGGLRAQLKAVRAKWKEDRDWRQTREAEFRSTDIEQALRAAGVDNVKAVARNFSKDIDPRNTDAVKSWLETEAEYDYIRFADAGAGNQGAEGNGQGGTASPQNTAGQQQRAGAQAFQQAGKPSSSQTLDEQIEAATTPAELKAVLMNASKS